MVAKTERNKVKSTYSPLCTMNVAETWTAITDDTNISPNSAVSFSGSTMLTYHRKHYSNNKKLSYSRDSASRRSLRRFFFLRTISKIWWIIGCCELLPLQTNASKYLDHGRMQCCGVASVDSGTGRKPVCDFLL